MSKLMSLNMSPNLSELRFLHTIYNNIAGAQAGYWEASMHCTHTKGSGLEEQETEIIQAKWTVDTSVYLQQGKFLEIAK